MREYRQEALRQAQRQRDRQRLTHQWAALVQQHRVVRVFFKRVRQLKEQKGMQIMHKYAARQLQRAWRRHNDNKPNSHVHTLRNLFNHQAIMSIDTLAARSKRFIVDVLRVKRKRRFMTSRFTLFYEGIVKI